MTDFLNVDGVRLECVSIGDAARSRPTLVLLHEGLGCVDMWRDFPQQLHDRSGLHVFAYSRRGYGRSDPRPPPWPTNYMHEEGLVVLPRVLAAAGLADVVLVGHSDGASIALIYAGAVGGNAAVGLVLLAPHVFNEPVCVASIERTRQAYLHSDLRDRLEPFHGRNVDGAFWGWNGAWLDPGFRRWNIERYLPPVSVPTLLIQGECDQYGTLAQIDAIERQIRGPARREIVPDCRHSPHADQPERVLRSIEDYLADFAGPRRGP